MVDEKFILDATAGFRMMWFDKKQKNTIYLDQRPECEPDIVGDFRDLKQFKDETFRLIVFDPPHKILSDAAAKGCVMIHNFGRLLPETWSSDLKHGFKECWRVLANYGILIFKWHEADKTISEIAQYFPSEPLFAQKTNTTKGRNKGTNGIRKPAGTYWFCFMKIPEEKVEA